MRRYFLLLVLTIVLFAGCNSDDDNNDVVPDGYVLQIGNSMNSIFYSNMQIPDTLAPIGEHLTIREIDLLGDSIAEFLLIAEKDSIAGNTVFQSVRLEESSSFNGVVKTILFPVIPEDSQNVYSYNDMVVIGNNFSVITVKMPLAEIWDNYVTGDKQYSGIWFEQLQKYFIIRFEKNGNDYVSWIKISVTDFDKYILYNYATFKI
ncbi:MAG: hypothetical protein K8R86_11515 [Bacteroidales bacterium]|nr:hypothetical protein [Bacteroidales bacterium]